MLGHTRPKSTRVVPNSLRADVVFGSYHIGVKHVFVLYNRFNVVYNYSNWVCVI